MRFYLRIFLALVLPLVVGCLLLLPVINSGNGYVAGFVFLPLFIFVVLIAAVFLIAGAIMTALKGRAGLWWLPAGPLLIVGFFGLALIAKQFELGAYREEPMISLTPTISNIVVFKKDTTAEQIEHFWENTVSTQRPDGRGHEHLPGVGSTGRVSARDGHDIGYFSFFPSATDQQKAYAYDRVRSSPIVHELRENVRTKDYMPDNVRDGNASDDPPKKTVVYNAANSSQ